MPGCCVRGGSAVAVWLLSWLAAELVGCCAVWLLGCLYTLVSPLARLEPRGLGLAVVVVAVERAEVKRCVVSCRPRCTLVSPYILTSWLAVNVLLSLLMSAPPGGRKE